MLKKMKKMFIFVFFNAKRHLPIFSPLLPISFIPKPRQYIRRHDICNFDIDIEGELIKIWSSLAQEGTNQEGEQNDHYQESSIAESITYESIEYPHCLVDDYLDSNFDHISEEDQSHGNYDMIVSEHPCSNGIDKIPYPILNQDVSVQCVDTELASSLAIIPGIQLKDFFSHQIPRSIMPSHLGENFQSTLSSQIFESSCMGFCSNQAFIFEIFSQESKRGHIIEENALHFPS